MGVRKRSTLIFYSSVWNSKISSIFVLYNIKDICHGKFSMFIGNHHAINRWKTDCRRNKG